MKMNFWLSFKDNLTIIIYHLINVENTYIYLIYFAQWD